MSKFIIDLTVTETRQLEINAPDEEVAQEFAQEIAETGGVVWDSAEILDQVFEIDNVEDVSSDLEDTD